MFVLRNARRVARRSMRSAEHFINRDARAQRLSGIRAARSGMPFRTGQSRQYGAGYLRADKSRFITQTWRMHQQLVMMDSLLNGVTRKGNNRKGWSAVNPSKGWGSANFDPAKHPRDWMGKFARKGGPSNFGKR